MTELRNSGKDDIKGHHCQLLGFFAIVIQMVMGMCIIASLLYKRWREYPRRPWLIWFYDVSKQCFGAAFVHMFNLGLSDLFSQHGKENSNPCVWYLLNLLLDTTLGVYILYVILKLVHNILSFFQVTHIKSGYYGKPPKFLIWFKQTSIFCTCLFLMKIVVGILLFFFPFILDIGEWFLSPFEDIGDPRAQIIFVMFVIPLIMNIIQFWITDYIIKDGPNHTLPYNHELEPSDISDDNEARGGINDRHRRSRADFNPLMNDEFDESEEEREHRLV